MNNMERMVLGQLPRGELPPNPNFNANPKANPNPNRGAIFLGGNSPDTGKNKYKKKEHNQHSSMFKVSR